MRVKTFFFSLAVMLGLVAAAAGCAAIYAFDWYQGKGTFTADTTVILPQGAGFKQITAQLHQAGVIDEPLLFQGMVAALGQARQFKAGEYLFKAGASPKDVARLIASGKVVVHKITVPEGLEAAEVLALLSKEELLTGELPGQVAEGSILPETYHFQRGEARATVLARMQDDMKKVLGELWAQRSPELPLASDMEALTLASIVEKETGVADERGRVAAVFVNRLKRGMRLQSDPTVVYGLERAMGGPLGRPLTTVDLQTPTPYNTYTIAALPPGPIASPGKAAIKAVMNPPQTDDLYFVATGSGGHRFAATLDEHNHNVAMYRKALAQAKN